MSKMNMEFDTESKKCVVSIDGKEVENLSYLNVVKNYYGDGKDYCEIYIRDPKKDGMRKMTRIVANENGFDVCDRKNIELSKIL